MKSFWQDLAIAKKPFFALAPMEGATDSLFRQIISITGKPDVFFTEFTNVEGLFSKGEGMVERRLRHTKSEFPLIAQIWGLEPNLFYKAAKLLRVMNFTGIDINMGCPDVSVTKKGACSALIKNKSLAKEIITAVKEGASDLPVSVKTRLGFSEISINDWIEFLLDQQLDALIVHGRTRKEMSKVPAHWNEIGKVVKLRNMKKLQTVIVGNGDIKSRAEGVNIAEKHNVDGIMIGRGVFENAWIFKQSADVIHISYNDRIDLLNKHLTLYENEPIHRLPYHTLKKYFKIYIRDFDGANVLRQALMETDDISSAREVLKHSKQHLD